MFFALQSPFVRFRPSLPQLPMALNAPQVLRRWIPIATVSSALCLLVYVAVQQSIRQGANDPQVQLANDAAAALARGAQPDPAPVAHVDLRSSLAPFLVRYDEAGKPTGGSGYLNGTLPSPPAGVFDFARSHGEHRVTWMPERAVRVASVIVHVPGTAGGFVLAGRRMDEIEARTHYVLVACASMIVVTALLSLALIVAGDLVSPRR
jgi:hypothetical protein